MSLYLDASVVIPTLVGEASSAAVDGFLRLTEEPQIVSELVAVEVASALARLVRMAVVSGEMAADLLKAFDVWRLSAAETLEFEPVDFRAAGNFVRRFDLGLRAPDALHAAVCLRGGHTLVTLDLRLARAATSLGLEVMVPA